jgi:hypothetical protein
MGGFDWDLEAAVQFGRIGDQDIRAWTAATDVGYTFGALPLQPRVGLKADIASGDRRASDGRLNTFNALYPKLPYFSEANLVAPANLIDLQPSLTLAVAPTVELRLAWNGIWRHRTGDAVYGTPLAPIRGTAGQPGRFTGHQVIIGLGWQATPSLTLSAEYVHFEVGGALRRAGGEDVDFLKLSAAYRF